MQRGQRLKVEQQPAVKLDLAKRTILGADIRDRAKSFCAHDSILF